MTARCTVPGIVILLSLTSGCSRQAEQKPSPHTAAQTTRTVSEVFNVEKRANKCPGFSWKNSQGNTVSFDSFRGKATLVNFWATWCGPCKRELPDLVALHKELTARGVKILGISTDRGGNVTEDVRAFAEAQGIEYQVVVANDELEEAFGNVRLLPTSFIIDAEGNILQTFVGPRNKAFFAEALLAVAK